jgi:argininosuccinate synthase
MSDKEKVVLAYSGGLDTSVIVKWLAEKGYEVICLAVDVGQRDLSAEMEEKALKSGAVKCIVADVKEEFARDFVFPAIQWNARYEAATALAPRSLARSLVKNWCVLPKKKAPRPSLTVLPARATTRSVLS